MKFINKLQLVPMLSVVLVCMVVPSANAAFLPGTTPVTANSSVPLLAPVPPGTAAGTLLASVTDPFNIMNAQGISVATGTLAAAVFRNTTGTLDFYYQVSNNASSMDPVERETNFSFLLTLPEFLTAVGFRTDGGTLGGVFTAGAVAPVLGDRSMNGDTVGFQFGTAAGAPVQPGQKSQVLVVSTDATNFTQGSSNVIDGGVSTVLTFRPAAAAPNIPEPASFVLLGGGMLALAGIRRLRRA